MRDERPPSSASTSEPVRADSTLAETEVDILVFQDLVFDEEVVELCMGAEVQVTGICVWPGPTLTAQRTTTGRGTVLWTHWDGLNRTLRTVIRTEAYSVLSVERLVTAPAALPRVGQVVEYVGLLYVLRGDQADDLDAFGIPDLSSTWTVHAVQLTEFTRDYLMQASPVVQG